jgi:hypothetical protein
MGGACRAEGEERGGYRGLVGNLRERDHWDGRIILRWIFRK